MPPNAAGLAISPVLGSGNSTLTYYTTVNLHFWYYDPVTSVWIDTGDSTGTSSTVNIGAGGGFIYSVQPLGNFPSVFRYDGTGDATFVGTVPSLLRPYDIAVDCAGNYYVMNNIGPFWGMTKHDPNGVLLQAYTVNNPSIYGFSGGMAIIGNDVYADDFNSGGIAHGTISGNTVNFTNISATVPFTQSGHSIGDFATLPFDAAGILPTLTITASDTVICSGSTVHFASNASIGGGQFQWQVNGAAIANATNDSFSYTPNNNDIITCEMATNGACAGVTVISLPIIIHVQPAPAASFTLVAASCINDTVIAVADTPLNIAYQWNFDGASVLSGSGPGPYELIWNSAGNRTITLLAGQGNCTANASKSISISDAPVLQLIAENTTVCLGDTLSLLASSGNNSIQWLEGNNYTLLPTEGSSAKVLPNKACTVFAKATNSAGCSTTKGIDIHIAEHCCVMVIPSAFSPNSDGLNDVFQPLGNHFNIQSFKVFDRWGEVVFSGYNNNAGWNGTYNGKVEDIGSYFYSIKYSCLESGNTIERKGDVTLIR
jgi:gliding motility-associated-like protein